MENPDHIKKVTILNLFFIFLKIGSTAFGGFMALISIVQRQLVEKSKLIDNASVLDGISLATVLPGPMAVNVVTFIGYRLRGFWGAIAAFTGVILPSFLLMLLLSFLYIRYGDLPEVGNVFNGIIPAVCAIILAVAINLAKKNIKFWWQWIIMIGSLLLLLFAGSFIVTILIISVSSIAGIMISRKINDTADKVEKKREPGFKIFSSPYQVKIFAISAGLILIFYLIPYQPFFQFPEFFLKLHSIFFNIGMVSVTLFGGGYVFIPALQELFVDQLHWLNRQEFIDAIAMGQVTPGPIMISAAFVGYKLAGFWGACAGTLAIFAPPALIMIVAGKFLESIKHSPHVSAAFRGIHPAVIGMILAAVIIIGSSMEFHWLQLVTFAIAFILVIRYRIDAIFIIPAAGLAGYLFG